MSCNPQAQPRHVLLQCVIYSASSTVGHVRWYRSESGREAGIDGELVGVQAFNASTAIPFSRGPVEYIGLAEVGSNLDIDDFTEDDNGHYWCQIEVNNSCLRPSTSGYVEFSPEHSRNCSSDTNIVGLRLLALGQRPICADGISSRCHRSREEFSSKVLVSTATPVPTPSPCLGSEEQGEVTSATGYGVIGFLVFIAAMLSAGLTLLVVVGLSRRCTIRTRSNGESIQVFGE